MSRQTLNAYPQLLDSIDAPDARFGIGNPDYPDTPPIPIPPAELRSIAGVERVSVLRLLFGAEILADGGFDIERTAIATFVEGSPTFPLIRGRWPAEDAPNEVALSTGAVDIFGADLNETFQFAIAPFVETEEETEITIVEPVVVGVFGPASADGPVDSPTATSWIITSKALLEARPDIGMFQFASLWVSAGSSVEQMTRALEEQFGAVELETRAQTEAQTESIVRPEAYAVLGFGLAAALVGAIITSLAIARQMANNQDAVALLAIGLRRAQRAAQIWIQAFIAIAVGTILGFVGSLVVAAELGAIGVANAFDRSHLEARVVVVVSGAALALCMVLGAIAAASAWSSSRVERRSSVPTLAPAWVNAVMAVTPMEVRAGTALANRGTGNHRATRAAVLGVAMSVTIGVAVTVFASSLSALTSTPALYGSDFDLVAFDQYGRIDDDEISAVLLADPDVIAISQAAGANGSVDGRDAGLNGFDNFTVGPRITSGAAPVADDEVMLGRRLATRLARGVGDEVTVVVGDESRIYRIVGLGVMPDSKGDGAAFTLEGLRLLLPDAQVSSQYARLRSEADPNVSMARYGEAFACPSNCDITEPSPPADIAYLSRVGDLPRLSVAAVIVLGVAVSIHALLIVGRRSRRAIAVLRAIGATRNQVARFLLSQALIIAALAILIGVVGGLVLGRLSWNRYADGLGVVPDPRIHVAAIVVAVATLAAITTAAATIPAWRSANRPVAPELQAD